MDKLNLVQDTAKRILELLDVPATIRCEAVIDEDSDSGEVYNVYIEGEGLGYLIGNGGKHMRSLQHVIRLLVNKTINGKSDGAYEENVKVNVDVAGYRKSRYDKIERLAIKRAEDARLLGEAIDLEPMSAAERRVVHVTLSKFDDLTTESFGEGHARYVRIIPKSLDELGISTVKSEEAEESEE